MRRSSAALLAALILSPLALRAEMEIAPPVKITWNGFLQHWASVGETPKYEYAQSGTLLKRLRFKMGVEAYDGVNVVIVPELAGAGFVLLDGYAQIDLSKYLLNFSPPLTVTAGQFKTPFGLNRMSTPPQLALVDYSSVSNGVMGTTNFWDDGVMVSYKEGSLFKLDAAWVEGLGPDQANPGGNAFGTKQAQDFVGRLELGSLLPGLSLGGSIYEGQGFTSPGTVAYPVGGKDNPKIISGAFLRYALPGKSFSLDTEFLDRTLEKGGYTVQVAQYLVDSVQLVMAYDSVTDYQNDKADATRYMGGVNWFPGGPVRLSLNQVGSASGPSQAPTNTRSILQTQITW